MVTNAEIASASLAKSKRSKGRKKRGAFAEVKFGSAVVPIYRTQSNGRLCHELGARVADGFQVLNEPFHPSPAVRSAYGSDCDDSEPDKARAWLAGRNDIAGIKLVSNRMDSVFVRSHHEMFEQVVILNRDPVDIAISLEAAHQTEHWNRGDGLRGEVDPPRVRVSTVTLRMVGEFLGNLTSFRQLRGNSGLGGVKEVNYE